MTTVQPDSLLFLLGSDPEQFLALEVVSGKLVMSWNFGFPDGPVSKTVDNFSNEVLGSTLVIKMGLATTLNMVVMSINFDPVITDTYEAGYQPDFKGDVYIGGVYCQDLHPGFQDVLSSVDMHYRGCMYDIAFNSVPYDFSRAVENMGVTQGCVAEETTDLGGERGEAGNVNPNTGTLTNCAEISTGKITEAKTGGITSIVTLPPKANDDEQENLGETTTTPAKTQQPATTATDPTTTEATTTTTEEVIRTTTTAEKTTTFFDINPPPEQARLMGGGGDSRMLDDDVAVTSGNSATLAVAVFAAVIVIALVAAIVVAVRRRAAASGGRGEFQSVPTAEGSVDVGGPTIPHDIDW